MINKENCARHFVDAMATIARYNTGVAFTRDSDVIEKNLRIKHVEALKKRNVLRVLLLTNNMNEYEYQTKARQADAEITALEALIWPNK